MPFWQSNDISLVLATFFHVASQGHLPTPEMISGLEKHCYFIGFRCISKKRCYFIGFSCCFDPMISTSEFQRRNISKPLENLWFQIHFSKTGLSLQREHPFFTTSALTAARASKTSSKNHLRSSRRHPNSKYANYIGFFSHFVRNIAKSWGSRHFSNSSNRWQSVKVSFTAVLAVKMLFSLKKQRFYRQKCEKRSTATSPPEARRYWWPHALCEFWGTYSLTPLEP